MKLFILIFALCLSCHLFVHGAPRFPSIARDSHLNPPQPGNDKEKQPLPHEQKIPLAPPVNAPESKPAHDTKLSNDVHNDNDSHDDDEDYITHHEIITPAGIFDLKCQVIRDFYEIHNGIEMHFREAFCSVGPRHDHDEDEKKEQKEQPARDDKSTERLKDAQDKVNNDIELEKRHHITFAVDNDGNLHLDDDALDDHKDKRNWLDKSIDGVTGAWHATKDRFAEIGEKFKHDHRDDDDHHPNSPSNQQQHQQHQPIHQPKLGGGDGSTIQTLQHEELSHSDVHQKQQQQDGHDMIHKNDIVGPDHIDADHHILIPQPHLDQENSSRLHNTVEPLDWKPKDDIPRAITRSSERSSLRPNHRQNRRRPRFGSN